MTKTYCDICEKEINYWKRNFSFPIEILYDRTIMAEHICQDCYDKINKYIINLKKEVDNEQ